MKQVITGARVWNGNQFCEKSLFLEDGVICESFPDMTGVETLDFSGAVILPGLIDVHVHFREPGFSYKETIKTGSKAAAHGGYTAVCTMPNLSPAPDSLEHLEPQLAAIKQNACIPVFPYGTITKGERGEELSDFWALSESVIAFSDDGRGVQSESMMRSAMEQAKKCGKMIAAHCEDNALLFGGYIHDGRYARKHGHRGISSESEWRQIERDLRLAKETGCAYHVCHISTKESVELIRRAKSEGVDVTCETAPHYLILCEDDLCEDGRFKMNPPLRSKEDQQALLAGILDGTIDMIATDHAPHSAEEKSRGLEKSAMGIVGLETAFPMLYTELVRTGILSAERLVQLMHDSPNRRFRLGQEFAAGKRANITIYDLDTEYRINPDEFFSQGRSTPFAGRKAFGVCLATIADGRMVWRKGETI